MAATDAMPVPKKNVAYRHYFAIRDNTGAIVTTWAGQDSEVDKDGAGFADCTNEATEIGTSGIGYIDLTSTEMNADAVNLKVTVTNTNALPLVVTFFPEEAGDIRSDMTQISGDSTAADNLELAADGTGYNLGGGSIVAASVTGAVGSVTGNVGGNVVGSVANVTGGINTAAGTITTLDALDTAQDSQHSTTQTYLSTNLGLLGANATEAGGTGDQFTAIPWNASWDAEVQSEVADALGVFWTSPATLVDLVWDELLSGHAVSGSTGEALAAAGTAGDPWTTSLPGSYTGDQAGKVLADVLVDTGTTLPATLANLALETTAQSILTDTGTTLPATLATIEGKVDTADTAIDAIATTIGAAGAGLTEAGGTGDQLTALATQVSVDDLPTNAELATALAAADDAVLAAIAALNNLSAADVNAEVVDALATDTYAEPGQGAPSATASLAAKINYLHKAWRNKKTQTATTFSLFADDGTTVDQKATTSDDGTTTTIGEVATGP